MKEVDYRKRRHRSYKLREQTSYHQTDHLVIDGDQEVCDSIIQTIKEEDTENMRSNKEIALYHGTCSCEDALIEHLGLTTERSCTASMELAVALAYDKVAEHGARF